MRQGMLGFGRGECVCLFLAEHASCMQDVAKEVGGFPRRIEDLRKGFAGKKGLKSPGSHARTETWPCDNGNGLRVLNKSFNTATV